jgi:hypothetical protein
MKKLARTAYADLPERRLSKRARSALDQAMGKSPDQVIAGIAEERRAPEAAYDTGEIIEFGLKLIGMLEGVAGIYAPPARPAQLPPPAKAKATYGQGSPTKPAPHQKPSDITGTGK